MAAVLQACRSPSTNRGSPAPPGRPLGAIRAEHGKLVAGDGHEVRLTGVNWFGLETPNFAPHGLWARNWQDMLDQVEKAGFNAIRLPFSNQVLEAGSLANSMDATKNPDLLGLSGLLFYHGRLVAEGASVVTLMGGLGRSRIWSRRRL